MLIMGTELFVDEDHTLSIAYKNVVPNYALNMSGYSSHWCVSAISSLKNASVKEYKKVIILSNQCQLTAWAMNFRCIATLKA